MEDPAGILENVFADSFNDMQIVCCTGRGRRAIVKFGNGGIFYQQNDAVLFPNHRYNI